MKSLTRHAALFAILCLGAAVALPVVAAAPATTQGQASPEDAAPVLAPQADAQCITITVWARNPETGECQEFGTLCSVPEGWELYFDPETCANA